MRVPTLIRSYERRDWRAASACRQEGGGHTELSFWIWDQSTITVYLTEGNIFLNRMTESGTTVLVIHGGEHQNNLPFSPTQCRFVQQGPKKREHTTLTLDTPTPLTQIERQNGRVERTLCVACSWLLPLTGIKMQCIVMVWLLSTLGENFVS